MREREEPKMMTDYNYLTEQAPEIVSDIVKKDGVYYKHTFKKNEFNLYSLIKSEIVVK